jgi:hypothetical protein
MNGLIPSVDRGVALSPALLGTRFRPRMTRFASFVAWRLFSARAQSVPRSSGEIIPSERERDDISDWRTQPPRANPGAAGVPLSRGCSPIGRTSPRDPVGRCKVAKDGTARVLPSSKGALGRCHGLIAASRSAGLSPGRTFIVTSRMVLSVQSRCEGNRDARQLLHREFTPRQPIVGSRHHPPRGGSWRVGRTRLLLLASPGVR